MFVTLHALERYQIHHPEADAIACRQAIALGKEESPEFAQIFLGRKRVDYTVRYIIAPDNQGMFILHKEDGTVITYLRFQAQQKQFLEQGPKQLLEQGGPPVIELPQEEDKEARRKAKDEKRYRREQERHLKELEVQYGITKS